MPYKDPRKQAAAVAAATRRYKARKRAEAAAAPAEASSQPKTKRKAPAKRRPAPKRAAAGKGNGTPYEHLAGDDLRDAINREDLVTKALANREREGDLLEKADVEARATRAVSETVQAFETLADSLQAALPDPLGADAAHRVRVKGRALGETLAEVWS